MLNPDNPLLPIKPTINTKVNTSETARTKPQGPPRSDKDFKKIIDNTDSEQSQEDANQVREGDEEGKILSPFELATKKVKPTLKKNLSDPSLNSLLTGKDNLKESLDGLPDEGWASTLTEDNMTESPPLQPEEDNTQLNAEHIAENETIKEAIIKERAAMMARQGLKPIQPDILPLETDATVVPSKESKSKLSSSESKHSGFIPENADLSAVNPSIRFLPSTDDSISDQSTASPSRTIHDIVSQIVKSIQTVESQGKTDTIVTLQYPPILKGAHVVLTSFESASKEFNIAFTHLSGEAKQFLDIQLSQNSLAMALENKGIVVHMITTSTLAEVPIDTKTGQNFARGEQGQQQQQQSDQESEEET